MALGWKISVLCAMARSPATDRGASISGYNYIALLVQYQHRSIPAGYHSPARIRSKRVRYSSLNINLLG